MPEKTDAEIENATTRRDDDSVDDSIDPDEVVVEDGKETDDAFFWKVCVLCEAHMRRSDAAGEGR